MAPHWKVIGVLSSKVGVFFYKGTSPIRDSQRSPPLNTDALGVRVQHMKWERGITNSLWQLDNTSTPYKSWASRFLFVFFLRFLVVFIFNYLFSVGHM